MTIMLKLLFILFVKFYTMFICNVGRRAQIESSKYDKTGSYIRSRVFINRCLELISLVNRNRVKHFDGIY